MNHRLTIQYDGTDFHGWQIQCGLRTVQGELTRVLSLLDGRSVVVHGAGRTDAGVHATAQVASVELDRVFSGEKLRSAINGNLATDVRVIETRPAPEGFHARFSSTGKTYQYRIFNAPFMSPFWSRYALHDTREIDLDRMREGAKLYLGAHDWTALSAAQSDVKSRVRTITQMGVDENWCERGRGSLITVTASADGFLRYMVRSIVGTLLELARGERDESSIAAAITSRDRSMAGTTAPAHGLTLTEVHYD